MLQERELEATQQVCAVCGEPIEGIPYGPLLHGCCFDCWHVAEGNYGNVKMLAHGPSVGDVLCVKPYEDERQWKVTAVNIAARTVDLERVKVRKQERPVVRQRVRWVDL